MSSPGRARSRRAVVVATVTPLASILGSGLLIIVPVLGLSRWFRGPRPYLISGAAAIVIAATVPTLTIVAIASRAFAAYYAIEAVIAMRTSNGFARKSFYAVLALLMIAIALFALPAS